MIADIIINTTAKQVQQTFSYTVPDSLPVQVGSRVLVPFGRRCEEGIVIALSRENSRTFSFTLKSIIDVLSVQHGFQEEMVRTALWIRDYYLCNAAEALRLFMVEKKGVRCQRRIVGGTLHGAAAVDEQIYTAVVHAGAVSRKVLESRFGAAAVARLLQNGTLQEKRVWKNTISDKMEEWLQIVPTVDTTVLKRRPKQRELWEVLVRKGECSLTELRENGFSREVARRMAADGLLVIQKKMRETTGAGPVTLSSLPWKLTAEQLAAISAVQQDTEGRTYVLHGVTGSGKTEVYMQLAAQVIREGKQVLVLVPEIALTGQIVRRFSARFGEDVVVMHSQLSQGERQANWLRMKEGGCHICIGARSAVFTGVRNLGLIIVDECHDGSYKQEETPRYHAIEVARTRAAYYKCPVILGSATPSVREYYLAEKGIYTLLELKYRVQGRPLPSVQVVDMREEFQRGRYEVLSPTLVELVEHTLQAGNQTIILLNRRGFSTFVMCRSCGFVVKCNTCDVPMVYHKDQELLRCHYCEARREIPKTCPACGSPYIKFFGTGTEKAAAELHDIFPAARVIRLDQDTTRRKNGGDRIIEAFRRGDYDILLGTQMVAKGHDFMQVTAVGILAADSLLNLPNYLAAERTFQLLTQAAGRAGRGALPGRVVMQTYAPEHYVVQYAKQQDFKGFYKEELAYRKTFLYPPFHQLIRILFQDEQETKVWQSAHTIASLLRSYVQEQGEAVEIIGPFVDAVKKVRNKYRAVILLKGADLTAIKKRIQQSSACFQKGIIIDVDPAW